MADEELHTASTGAESLSSSWPPICQGTDIKGNTSHTTDHFLFGQMVPRNYFNDVNGAKKYKIWKKVTLYL